MKEFKGTPGQWKIDDVEFVVCGDKCICAVGGIPFSAEDKANISMIAAAPDLLEALQEMTAIVKKNSYPQPDKPSSNYARAEWAESIISKALGEE
ncbi:hypothetical protein OI984_01800 [Enterobacter roggenkampii]|uniref:hypothetical protein n=1 Tax=Enterobacter roggenkampii TaxID=1812935 RepID=UPI002542E35B|nr:hypothetical protein [Enterobacter roggenkampii]WIJ49646.1 hypothetical protein OI984_01800 [Enterobacter roggenkampii]